MCVWVQLFHDKHCAKMFVTLTLILAIPALCFLWYIQRKRQQTVLAQMGIPGPKPESIISGSAGSLFSKGVADTYDEWGKQYGKTFGYYSGKNAIIVTSDLDLLHHVFIKDYDKFNGRELRFADRKEGAVGMFYSIGKTWKRLRTIASPSFTAFQMKRMSPTIKSILDRFMIVVKEHADKDEAFNIHDDFQRLTLDVIASCAFGMEVNSLENPDDIFLKKCIGVFDFAQGKTTSFLGRLRFLGYLSESFLKLLFKILTKFVRRPKTWFDEVAEKLIEERKREKIDRVDLLQLMMNVVDIPENIADQSLTADLTEDENIAKSESSEGRVQKLVTEQEIKGQLMLFLLAGFETTSTTLAFLAYDLALNPDVQEKAYKEVLEHFEPEDEPDYTSVQKLKYLEMVIQETLRHHPVAQVAAERQCNAPFRYGNYTIQPDMAIKAHMTAVHMNPDIWGPEDPKLFIPERHEPEKAKGRHPMAWMPFGAGPRNCIGMRFALLEIKMALVKILKVYEIMRCEETKVPLPLICNLTVGPKEGVHVKFRVRSK